MTAQRPAAPVMARVFAAIFAAFMVLSAAWPAGQAGFAAVAPATVAVLAGVFFRLAATVAVLLTVAAVALLDVPPLFAAGSGLSAAAYLVTRHAADRGGVAITVPAAIGLVSFTGVGLIATVVPLHITWAPLLGPAIVVAILVAVGGPMLRQVRAEPVPDPFQAPAADRDPPA